ncbi:MAG: hypothetical protein ACREQM_18380, partial [Candidatus Dormibacteraceae bacterium]
MAGWVRPELGRAHPSRLAHGGGAILLGLIIAAAIVYLPFAAVSFIATATSLTAVSYTLSRPTSGQASEPAVHLDLRLTALDELQGLATVEAYGYQVCAGRCAGAQRVIVYSLTGMTWQQSGLPPSSSLTLPADSSQVSNTMQLPLPTRLFLYPFDSSRLVLGVALERSG